MKFAKVFVCFIVLSAGSVSHAVSYFDGQIQKMNAALQDIRVRQMLNMQTIDSINVSPGVAATYRITSTAVNKQSCTLDVVVTFIEDGSFSGKFEVSSVGQNICK